MTAPHEPHARPVAHVPHPWDAPCAWCKARIAPRVTGTPK